MLLDGFGCGSRGADLGSLAVVFFFATWCVSCEKVLPDILSVAASEV